MLSYRGTYIKKDGSTCPYLIALDDHFNIVYDGKDGKETITLGIVYNPNFAFKINKKSVSMASRELFIRMCNEFEAYPNTIFEVFVGRWLIN